jgi:hypothetical protein
VIRAEPPADGDAAPIRIFVGCDPDDCDLEQMMVLEHSLRRHASLPLAITWMRLSRDPASPFFSDGRGAGWRTERWATPFSGLRWAVPSLCGHTGRAIYMDADVLALGDIAELWRAPVETPHVVLGRRFSGEIRLCVSLWDCARAGAALPALAALQSDPRSHEACTRRFATTPGLVGDLDPAFNAIDGEGLAIEAIRMLHYSDMGTQFSHRLSMPRLAAEGRTHWFDGRVRAHPRRDLAALFERIHDDALASGRRLDDYRNPSPFGGVPKRSERHHRGNEVTRPGLRGRLRALLAGPR